MSVTAVSEEHIPVPKCETIDVRACTFVFEALSQSRFACAQTHTLAEGGSLSGAASALGPSLDSTPTDGTPQSSGSPPVIEQGKMQRTTTNTTSNN